MVFNESSMQKVAEHPIELRRVTFSVVITTDGPTMKIRAALRSAASTAINTVTTDTSLEQDPVRHESSVTATTATPATNEKPASLVLPRKSDKLSQPSERYSPGLFYTDSGERTSFNEAQQSEDFLDWQRAMESDMNSIHANGTWDLVELPKNCKALPWRWSIISSRPPIPHDPSTKPGLSQKDSARSTELISTKPSRW